MSEPYTLEWTKILGSSEYDTTIDVAIDSNDNVYIVGSTNGSLDGPNVGLYDGYLVKYDSSTGTKLWTKMLGTTAYDSANSVAIDSNNNVYITGQTADNLDGQNTGFDDAFLAKYDSTGTKIWTKMLGSSAADYGNSVAID